MNKYIKCAGCALLGGVGIYIAKKLLYDFKDEMDMVDEIETEALIDDIFDDVDHITQLYDIDGGNVSVLNDYGLNNIYRIHDNLVSFTGKLVKWSVVNRISNPETGILLYYYSVSIETPSNNFYTIDMVIDADNILVFNNTDETFTFIGACPRNGNDYSEIGFPKEFFVPGLIIVSEPEDSFIDKETKKCTCRNNFYTMGSSSNKMDANVGNSMLTITNELIKIMTPQVCLHNKNNEVRIIPDSGSPMLRRTCSLAKSYFDISGKPDTDSDIVSKYILCFDTVEERNKVRDAIRDSNYVFINGKVDHITDDGYIVLYKIYVRFDS